MLCQLQLLFLTGAGLLNDSRSYNVLLLRTLLCK
jgi:hypothetical protein